MQTGGIRDAGPTAVPPPTAAIYSHLPAIKKATQGLLSPGSLGGNQLQQLPKLQTLLEVVAMAALLADVDERRSADQARLRLQVQAARAAVAAMKAESGGIDMMVQSSSSSSRYSRGRSKGRRSSSGGGGGGYSSGKSSASFSRGAQ